MRYSPDRIHGSIKNTAHACEIEMLSKCSGAGRNNKVFRCIEPPFTMNLQPMPNSFEGRTPNVQRKTNPATIV